MLHHERDLQFINASNINNNGTLAQPHTDLNNLFHGTTYHLYPRCHQHSDHTDQYQYEANNEHQFLIIILNNIYVNVTPFKPFLISNFQPQNVQIPTIPHNSQTGIVNQQLRYTTQAVLIREGHTSSGGHF